MFSFKIGRHSSPSALLKDLTSSAMFAVDIRALVIWVNAGGSNPVSLPGGPSAGGTSPCKRLELGSVRPGTPDIASGDAEGQTAD